SRWDHPSSRGQSARKAAIQMFWILHLWVDLAILFAISTQRKIARTVIYVVADLAMVAATSAAGRVRRRRTNLRDAAARQSIDEMFISCRGAEAQPDLAQRESRPQIIDQHVRFTVYRPARVRPEVWNTMLAFAYRAGDEEEGSTDIGESFKEVE